MASSKIKVTKLGVFFSIIMITILFYGYAQAVIAPQSALGSFTSSGYGFVFWSLLVTSPFALLEFLAKKYSKVVFFYSE